MAELDVRGIFTAFTDHLNRTGVFDALATTHELKTAAGRGRRVGMWFQQEEPAPEASDLESTAAVIVINIRLHQNMLAEPQDDIDPDMLETLDKVMRVLHADFTLGGIIRNIDVFGKHGVRLRSQAGYIQQDKSLYRIIDITVPLVVSDLWTQAP